ncbi:TadE/TadG family type IV pilus assembly protein [Microlunatus ginsengisoli]|uniref:Putative Flp pilus-assembly TadG-like N-terminal domain-containing protein n=1 Tax=Microlunatus ginsengisoli TaxID=363863 RepID=A0ABP7ARX2_9ACTN
MQRLTSADRERGAVAVVVAILMVALLGMAALAVDVGGLWAKRRQLQNGADAGALAIAQACAKGACGSTSATANSYASSNVNDGAATGTVLELTAGKVTVRTADTQQHWFARIWGSNDSNVHAQATAVWGGPNAGATFPLAFSVCEWNWQNGGPGGLDSTVQRKIVLTKTSTSNCVGPSGNVVPGGFGWVDPTSGTCTIASLVNGWITSSTGNTPPNGCNPSNFDALVGKTVLIPVFDNYTGTGNNASYHVYGYAAFRFTGYYFSGQYKNWPTSGVAGCSGSERCIAGYFTRYVDLNEVLTTDGGGPSLGLSIISLIK